MGVLVTAIYDQTWQIMTKRKLNIPFNVSEIFGGGTTGGLKLGFQGDFEWESGNY